MAKRNEVFPSRFWKEIDLDGKPLELEIQDAPLEELGTGADKETKTVLHFRGVTKVLPLNRVNWDSVAEIAGDDTDDWAGARIELYPSTTLLHGKTVPCIRVRASRQKELLPKPKPPQKPKSQALQKKLEAIAGSTAVKADMDDEIPFRKID